MVILQINYFLPAKILLKYFLSLNPSNANQNNTYRAGR